MGRLIRPLAALFVLSLLITLSACGMGGTEVGNPRPGTPAAEGGDSTAQPTLAPETPSPTPDVEKFEVQADGENNLE